MPSLVMLPNLKQKNDHLSPVNQARRLSVIRGPSHPPLMNITLGELTRRQSQKHADRMAIVSQHQNEVISYSQLHEYSDDLAAGMISQGVERGDRVAVMLGNRSEYVYVRMSIYFYAPSN
jgi:mevalonyl-CoA ligase